MNRCHCGYQNLNDEQFCSTDCAFEDRLDSMPNDYLAEWIIKITNKLRENMSE